MLMFLRMSHRFIAEDTPHCFFSEGIPHPLSFGVQTIWRNALILPCPQILIQLCLISGSASGALVQTGALNTHTHTHTYTHLHTHTHTRTHTHTHTQKHTHTPTHTLIHTHPYANAHTHTYVKVYKVCVCVTPHSRLHHFQRDQQKS